jgi:hypothetical protein
MVRPAVLGIDDRNDKRNDKRQLIFGSDEHGD